MRYLAIIGEREIPVEVIRRGPGRYVVRIEGRERVVESRGRGASRVIAVEGKEFETTVVAEGHGDRTGPAWNVIVGGRGYPVRLEDPLRRAVRSKGLHRAGKIEVCSIMPGRVSTVLVKEGDEVAAGQGLIVVEAMKMENEIPAPKAGRVAAIAVRAGETVEAGAALVSLE